jgi:hypothetical protein
MTIPPTKVKRLMVFVNFMILPNHDKPAVVNIPKGYYFFIVVKEKDGIPDVIPLVPKASIMPIMTIPVIGMEIWKTALPFTIMDSF